MSKIMLSISNAGLKWIRPICPANTLRGHVWLALKRFVQAWEMKGFKRAVHSVWVLRIRPLYSRHPTVPDNLFLSRPVRVHHHRLLPHTASVDIVICVHNALLDVKACLSSVVRYTRPPYRIILVDDGSADETGQFLAGWAGEQQALLIRHPQALGYTRAANAGLRASSASKVVFLNSDTQVTPLWLDRLVACAESDPRVGLVGPLSNAASWQSVPEILNAEGDWMENPLPEGYDPQALALSIGRNAVYLYPRMPFLNGFCLLIKRDVIDQIGGFDETHFGQGYGEENDYAIRARKAGWALAVADDAYVWHRQSQSYSHERRKQLSAKAHEILCELHGAAVFAEGCDFCRTDLTLQAIRARVRVGWEKARLIQAGMEKYEGQRILFVLPTLRPGGGSHVVVQEARALQRMGVDVRLFNFSRFKQVFHEAHPEITIPILYGQNQADLARLLPHFDAVVATLYASVKWIDPVLAGAPRTVRGYYIQDYEPFFFEKNTPRWKEAVASYSRIPGMVRLTKTDWNRRIVQDETGQACTVIGPSVDLDLFVPRQRALASKALKVIAMVRPESPRRNPEMTLRVLKALHQRLGARVEIYIFGCDSDDPLYESYLGTFPFVNLGILTRTEMAQRLPEMDLFLDLSTYQAMGLTALEAMACGVAVVVPQAGGAGEFARPGWNAWMVDTTSEAACLEAALRLADDPELLRRLRSQALQDVCAYYPEKAAYRLLEALFDGTAAGRREEKG